MRRMGERRAWLYLASRWDNASLGANGIALADVCPGLCFSVDWVYHQDLVTMRTFDKMRDRLEAYVESRRRRKLLVHAYLYPRDMAGAKKRAALCRRFAKACAR